MSAFWKNKDKDKEEKKSDKTEDVKVEKEIASTGDKTLPIKYGVLKGFYISEKSSMLNSLNQYVFKVFKNTTKNEIRKNVEKSFGVKVKEVKTINLPGKKRNVGRHSGIKPGLKKAVVVLEKGYSIDQAKV